MSETINKFAAQNSRVVRVAISPGESAGVGPDLIVQLAQQDWPVELVVCASPTLLSERAEQLGLPLTLQSYRPGSAARPQRAATLTILPIELVQPAVAGVLCPANSDYVLRALTRATDGCLDGVYDDGACSDDSRLIKGYIDREFAALVTGPVHKGVINDAGISFSGHTEFLASRAGCDQVVMMLATETLRVALVTTHLPLKAVSSAITEERLRKVITLLHKELRNKFGVETPHIFVCGLNPHAGEGGHMGREEMDVIIPALNLLRAQGIKLTGPLPADTLFQAKYLTEADAVLAMYHDQGLPVLKYQGFGKAVNITLGLPFIRTSVDHGTALELAGTGAAKTGSFTEAVNLAIKMVRNTLQSYR